MTDDSRHSAEMSDDELFDDGEDVELPEQQVDLDGGPPQPTAQPEPKPEARQPTVDPFDDDSDGQPPEPAPQLGEEPDADDKTKREGKPKAGEDGDEEDAEQYSKKVQRRINKEVARRKSVETEAERLARENNELRQRLGYTESQALEHSIADLESQKTNLRGQLTKAIEDGDTEKQVDLTEQLGGVNYKLEQANQLKARTAPRQPQEQQPTGEQQPRPAPQQPQPQRATPEQQREAAISRLPPKSQTWVRERGFFDWKESQRAFAMGVDAELTGEGYDPGTDDYYAEMDKRISAAFPDLYDDADSEPEPKSPPKKQTQAATPVAAPSAAPPGGQQSGGKVTLGPADFQQMRTFGLDPNNADHVRTFAQEKQRSARAEQ